MWEAQATLSLACNRPVARAPLSVSTITGGTGAVVASGRVVKVLLAIFAMFVAACLLAPAAMASCAGLAQGPALFTPVSATLGAKRVSPGELRITFLGHSTFEVESPMGAIVQTDYNDYVRGQRIPHVATMNNAHDTHYTMFPPAGDSARIAWLGSRRGSGPA